jgi:hypothetical protein
MHTIVADYGRSTREITDVEWDIRTVPARFEKQWTYGSAWGDHLTSTARLTNEMLARELSYIRMCRPALDARAERHLISNRVEECRLRSART